MILQRLDSERCLLPTATGAPALLFANADVAIDRASIEDVWKLSQTADSIDFLRHAGILPPDAALSRMVFTPDFHKASAAPVGSVIETTACILPQAPGNDIGCGMALATFNIGAEEIAALDSRLDNALRHAFFAGGRHIELDAENRLGIMRNGLQGLQTALPFGLLGDHRTNALAWASRAHNHGKIGDGDGIDVLAEWIRPGRRAGQTRDSFLGTIGGGNHFVELQAVETIFDRELCWRWKLKPGQLAVMAHSGSLSLGRAVALKHIERAKALWPKGAKHPVNGIYILPFDGHDSLGAAYLADMQAAVHIAMANRTCMILMVASVLSSLTGRQVIPSLVHDLPHNAAWIENGKVVHRKGACPAPRNFEDETFYDGAPVIVPGSMGTCSYLLAGLGSKESLASAPHGAGRAITRNAGRATQNASNETIRVVGKIDTKYVRSDIAKAAAASLNEEADGVYKDIEPIISTITAAGIASPVARLKPILTIKG